MDFAIAIHGGAGTIRKVDLTDMQAAEIKIHLTDALYAARTILEAGGNAVNAVEAAVRVLEDSPHFNAGHGAVFTAEGAVELDAAIMDGRTLSAGAVAGVRTIRNPISLARMVMNQSPHVMMIGRGAEDFANTCGAETVSAEYFHTERRLRELKVVQALAAHAFGTLETENPISIEQKFGTVGAVARDQHGNLAAATSTGGMTNKRWGRVGDSPLIGAGTYADNQTCAVSATGHGEYFIRACVAHDIAARMRYAGQSLAEAATGVIHGSLTALGGSGGVIAVDKDGNLALPFNTAGMYRGTLREGEAATIAIYRND
jgi:L-asparaginase / beta-aspartyl-peptidase